MPKWISVEKAVIKYHIEKEAILLWVEMGQFPMLYIDNVPNVDEECILELFRRSKAGITAEYIDTLEQLCIDKTMVCEKYAHIIQLKEKEIQLEVQCSPLDLQKTADVDLLTSFVLNLVDNAGKASENGGKIRIIADDKALIVEDQGRGIAPEEIERVTEAFYMVDKSRSRKEGGAGLGLALCKEIADLHHWELTIESESGNGTRVILLWLQRGYELENTRPKDSDILEAERTDSHSV